MPITKSPLHIYLQNNSPDTMRCFFFLRKALRNYEILSVTSTIGGKVSKTRRTVLTAFTFVGIGHSTHSRKMIPKFGAFEIISLFNRCKTRGEIDSAKFFAMSMPIFDSRAIIGPSRLWFFSCRLAKL